MIITAPPCHHHLNAMLHVKNDKVGTMKNANMLILTLEYKAISTCPLISSQDTQYSKEC